MTSPLGRLSLAKTPSTLRTNDLHSVGPSASPAPSRESVAASSLDPNWILVRDRPARHARRASIRINSVAMSPLPRRDAAVLMT